MKHIKSFNEDNENKQPHPINKSVCYVAHQGIADLSVIFSDIHAIYAFSDDYNDKIQIGDEIKYGGYSKTKMDSIEKVLETIVDNDLYSKDNSDNW